MRIRFGIRARLVMLILAGGVLPLLVALALMEWQFGWMRRAAVGQGYQAMAVAKAREVQTRLREDVRAVYEHAREPAVAASLAELPAALPADLLSELDRRWPTIAQDSPEFAAVLSHPAAAVLHHFVRTEPRCREALITDRLGQLAAASGRTSDFYQADEDWWQAAYNQGLGLIHVSQLGFDESALTWSVDISVPIYADGQVVGVMKAIMDARDLLEHLPTTDLVEAPETLLVGDDGVILSGPGVEPLSRRVERWRPPVGAVGRWQKVGDNLRASAAVTAAGRLDGLEVRSPRWFVMLEAPASRAMAPVHRLMVGVLGLGLAVIAAAFATAMYLATLHVIRPIRRLRSATARVAAGDLSAGGLVDLPTGGDEIGQLAADFERMVQAVAGSHEALAAAGEMKSRFLMIAGHELRTPVAYVASLARLIARQDPSSQARPLLEKLAERAERLEGLVLGMFKLVEQQHGASWMKWEQFSAADLLTDVVEDFRPFAGERFQAIATQGLSAAPELLGDRRKLANALGNLLSNAIKFTPDGGVITVLVERLQGERLALRVRDEGGGISEEERPHIFETFWGGLEVLKHSSGRFGYRKRGPGLGLPIARQFVRMHGGEIEVASSPRGCVFSIIVPLRPPGAPPDHP